MTEKHISLTFNSDKYPDGTIRNQFKIDIQSKPSPRKKIGDIVEAKVVNIYGSEYIDLSTSEEETGVIKAMCVNCRKFMKMDEKTHKLICECGKIDSRNISSNYGGI